MFNENSEGLNNESVLYQHINLILDKDGFVEEETSLCFILDLLKPNTIDHSHQFQAASSAVLLLLFFL